MMNAKQIKDYNFYKIITRFAITLCVLLFLKISFGADYNYAGADLANWSVATNWAPNGTPNGTSDTITFNTADDAAPTLNANSTVSSITNDSNASSVTRNLHESVAEVLTLQASSGNAVVTNNDIDQTLEFNLVSNIASDLDINLTGDVTFWQGTSGSGDINLWGPAGANKTFSLVNRDSAAWTGTVTINENTMLSVGTTTGTADALNASNTIIVNRDNNIGDTITINETSQTVFTNDIHWQKNAGTNSWQTLKLVGANDYEWSGSWSTYDTDGLTPAAYDNTVIVNVAGDVASKSFTLSGNNSGFSVDSVAFSYLQFQQGSVYLDNDHAAGLNNSSTITLKVIGSSNVGLFSKNNRTVTGLIRVGADDDSILIYIGGDQAATAAGNTLYSGDVRLHASTHLDISNLVEASLYANNTEVVTFSGEIHDRNAAYTDYSNVSKTGSGTVIISSSTNSYNAQTIVREGTLSSAVNVTSGSAGAFGDGTQAVLVGDTTGSASATLDINTAGVSNARAITVQSGSSGIKTIGSSMSSGTATYSGDIMLSDSVNLSAASGGTSDFTGKLTSSGNLTISGLGTVQLTDTTNDFTGTLTASTGTLKLGASGVITDGVNLTFSGGTLDLNNKNETINDLDWTADSTLDFGSTAGANTFTIVDDDDTGVVGTLLIMNWEGSATDTFATTGFADAGNFLSNIKFNGYGGGATLSGSNIIPTTGASAMYIWDDAAQDVWQTGTDNWDLDTDNDSVIDVQNTDPAGSWTDATYENVKFASVGAGNIELDTDVSLNTIFFESAATGSFTIQDNVDDSTGHTITLAGTLPSIHQNDDNAHVIQNLDADDTVSISLSENLVVLGTGTGSLTISSVISGASKSVTKSGGFELILGGTNTYTGDTIMNAGTLTLSASGSIDGNLLINAGAVQGGTNANAVKEELTMNGGSISAGTLTTNGIFTFDGAGTSSWTGGTYVWSVTGNMDQSATDSGNGVKQASGIVGTDWDYISFTGALDFAGALNGGITIQIDSNGTYTGYDWDKATAVKILGASSINNFSESFFNIDSTGFDDATGAWWVGWSITNHDNALWLEYRAIPEPSTYAMILMVVLMVLLKVCRSVRFN